MAAVLPVIRYDPRRHCAARTEDYLFSQLIPYIGNKRKLLPLIAEGLALTGCHGGTFVDLFAGSSVVARLAKCLGFRVVANDWEPYAYEIARGTIALNAPPAFSSFGGACAVFEHLNALAPYHGYISRHLCPQDDEHPDLLRERMFFTRENGERIDAMREQIAFWEGEGRLSADERAYLLNALVYAASYVSNTSGVFKGFHNGWGGKTRTALYRIRCKLEMKAPLLIDNYEENLALREDAQQLAKQLPAILGCEPEIVYLDPPYNQHPYGSNYHVLNSIVLWDKPQVPANIDCGGHSRQKSAIRQDWRVARRSPYNAVRGALPAFKRLIERLEVPWILMSYSTDGNMPLEELLAALAEKGSLVVLPRRYKRYRVSTPRMSPKSHNVEFLAIVDTRRPAAPSRAAELAAQIRALENGCKGEGPWPGPLI